MIHFCWTLLHCAWWNLVRLLLCALVLISVLHCSLSLVAWIDYVNYMRVFWGGTILIRAAVVGLIAYTCSCLLHPDLYPSIIAVSCYTCILVYFVDLRTLEFYWVMIIHSNQLTFLLPLGLLQGHLHLYTYILTFMYVYRCVYGVWFHCALVFVLNTGINHWLVPISWTYFGWLRL